MIFAINLVKPKKMTSTKMKYAVILKRRKYVLRVTLIVGREYVLCSSSLLGKE